MNTRGLVELIVLNIGLDLGVITPRLFTMLVHHGARHHADDVADPDGAAEVGAGRVSAPRSAANAGSTHLRSCCLSTEVVIASVAYQHEPQQFRSSLRHARPDGAEDAGGARPAARLRHRAPHRAGRRRARSRSTRARSTRRCCGSSRRAGSRATGARARTTAARASTPSPPPASAISPRKPTAGRARSRWSTGCSPRTDPMRTVPLARARRRASPLAGASA